jgi:hypothetical protein
MSCPDTKTRCNPCATGNPCPGHFNPSYLSPGTQSFAQPNIGGRGPLKALGAIGWITVPTAWALSYQRNQSIWWAFLSGLIATPYLIFRGVEYGLDKGEKK